MTLSDFKKAMCRGSGSCMQELLTAPNPGKFKKTVLWGCLHNLSFDTQCEGTRAKFLFDLAKTYNDSAFFLDPVIAKFPKLPVNCSWDHSHYIDLLACFARDGEDIAKTAIREKYEAIFQNLLRRRAGSKRNRECFLYEELCIALVSIEGHPMMEKVAFDIGNLLLKNRSMADEPFYGLFMAIEDTLGKRKTNSWMKKIESRAPEYHSFLENYQRFKKPYERGPERKKPVTADEMKEALTAENPMLLADKCAFRHFSSDSEKIKLAEMAIEETNPKKKAEMLLVFTLIGFPISCSPLIECTQSDCEELQKAAYEVLGNSKAPEIHAFALTLLQGNTPFWGDAMGMLINNFKKSDRDLFLSLLSGMSVDYAEKSGWHGIVMTIIRGFHSGIRLPKESLRYVFENSLCSTCRKSAIRIMAKHRWLTGNIIEEGRFDSNLEIRKFLNRYYPRT